METIDVGLDNVKGRIVQFLDFDGDLKMDLLIQDPNQTKFSVYRNEFNTFKLLFELMSNSQYYIAADFNQDGLVDLVGVRVEGTNVELRYFQQEHGTLKGLECIIKK
jgi:hypothetical protein